jgi:hypothetical protein
MSSNLAQAIQHYVIKLASDLWQVRVFLCALIFLSVNWIYHTDKEYFLLENMENNHQCVPFGLFITNINLLLLLIFFSLAVL